MHGHATWIIGSSPACDVVVDFDSVTGQHCSLTHDGQNWLLADLGSKNGTFVDGYPLEPQRAVVVSQHNRITLGHSVPMPWPTKAPRQTGAISQVRGTRIGRGPENDIVIDYPMISREHARVFQENGQFILEDLNSSNGVAVNRLENRIQRAVIQPGDDIFLGSYKIPAVRLLSSRKSSVGEAAKQQVSFTGNELSIGRDPASNQHLDFPMISWRHAKLTRSAEGIFVEDLGSTNGTFVNGIRISGRVLVNPGDQIGLGTFRFQLLDGGHLVRREYHGNMTIEAAGVSVVVPSGKRLIEPVSFTIYPSEFVALMGPAGAGKTTLLKALNGYTPPAEGQVLFNGASLYDYYDLFRLQMGYVPQDDIVHPQLTVREALYYSVKLRTDLSDREIDARIEKVLKDLNVYDKIDTIIGSPERKVLSGGQRKRVNIALELIHDTPVLFLDEPTSGLSSHDAEGVVRLLKRLSQEGKTIVTTIHQPSLEMFREFDDLIMMARDPGGCGAMAFFGPAYPDSIMFFNGRPAREAAAAPAKELKPEMLLSGLDTQPTATWQQMYNASPYRKQFVEDRRGTQPVKKSGESAQHASRPFGLRQWIALTRRNAICKLRDRGQIAILLLQAPLFALLIVAVTVPLQGNLFLDLSKRLGIINFLMVVASIWFGCNNAARDVVGEWTMYQRERMVSLKLPSYVFSKMTVLFTICFFQCLVMLLIVHFGCGLHGDFFTQFAVLLLSAMIGSAIGLCISTRMETTESAIALLPVVLLPMIALGGGLQPIYRLSQPVQWVSSVVPSRWAFEANLSDEGVKASDDSLRWKKEDESDQVDPQKAYEQYRGDVAAPIVPRQYTPKAEHGQPAPHEKPFRKTLGQYVSILCSMLFVLVVTALTFLKTRDIH